jgi:hypothetical protein
VNGEEIGTFNDDTRPTSSQLITLIGEAVGDIHARIGPTPPVELEGAGRSAAAMLAACLIELSYLPEQVLGPQRVRPLLDAAAEQDHGPAGRRARARAGRQPRELDADRGSVGRLHPGVSAGAAGGTGGRGCAGWRDCGRPGPNRADVVDSLGDVAADRADVPIPPQDPLT